MKAAFNAAICEKSDFMLICNIRRGLMILTTLLKSAFNPFLSIVNVSQFRRLWQKCFLNYTAASGVSSFKLNVYEPRNQTTTTGDGHEL